MSPPFCPVPRPWRESSERYLTVARIFSESMEFMPCCAEAGRLLLFCAASSTATVENRIAVSFFIDLLEHSAISAQHSVPQHNRQSYQVRSGLKKCATRALLQRITVQKIVALAEC